MSHIAEEQLVAFYFGDAEGNEAVEIERHLHDCEACRRALAEVQRTLAAVERLPVPERSERYGTEVWLRIQPRLAAARTPAWRQALSELFVPRRLVYAGGFAAVVLAAFVAGRFWPAPTGNRGAAVGVNAERTGGSGAAGAATSPGAVGQRVLLSAVGDHLERSQMTLVELMNSPGDHPVDISAEQDRARDLVAANRLLRQTAQSTGHNGLASVLDDLERVLVEIANGPSTLSPKEFAGVRDRIESQGLVFKVQVLGERVRDNLRQPASRPAPGRLGV